MKPDNNIAINKRINERKNYKKDIVFVIGAMAFHGKCINISKGGARITNNSLYNIEVGKEILIAIPFPKRHMSIKRKSTVRWVEDDQFGISFYKRKDPRKIYQKKITIFTDAMIFTAIINNLSKGGANILIDNQFTLAKESEIRVIIPFARINNKLIKRSVVKWVNNGQCGIQFV